MRTPQRLGCLVATAITAMSATATPAVTDAEETALDEAIDAWNKLGADNYTFNFQNLCNCAAGATAKMRIEVVGSAILNVTYVEPVFELHQDRDDRDFHKILVSEKDSNVPSEFAENLASVGEFLLEMKRQIAKPLAEYDAEFDTEVRIPADAVGRLRCPGRLSGWRPRLLCSPPRRIFLQNQRSKRNFQLQLIVGKVERSRLLVRLSAAMQLSAGSHG